MNWSQTYTGGKWDFSNPDPDAVNWDDIAQGMSNACRFAGQTRIFYSVAEHCVRVHDFLKEKGADPQTRLYGLIHDAHEGYFGDLPTPFANAIGRELVARIKAEHDRAIFKAAGLAFPMPEFDLKKVKHADQVLLMSERDVLLSTPPEPWSAELEATPRIDLGKYVGWFPQAARRQWADRAQRYGLKVTIPGQV